jgi:hypothetical protein
MELNISIDFYIPCTLVILTYVKTGHPLSLPIPKLSELQGCFTVLYAVEGFYDIAIPYRCMQPHSYVL